MQSRIILILAAAAIFASQMVNGQSDPTAMLTALLT